MGKKWVKVDPATIKVGDRVRQVDVTSEYRQTVGGVVTYKTSADIELGGASLSPSIGIWYIRKPKPVKPLQRPDEPPVGSFFRVERTGGRYQRSGEESYYSAGASSPGVSGLEWDDITEPGDTWTRLELMEVRG